MSKNVYFYNKSQTKSLKKHTPPLFILTHIDTYRLLNGICIYSKNRI
jgi:hypothetical protein